MIFVAECNVIDCCFQEENVSSVSWNSWCDELLAMSGGGSLTIKAGAFPPASHPVAGSVVGFQVTIFKLYHLFYCNHPILS